MFFSKRHPLIVGLDIGTSAIKIAVGERRSDDGLSMIGSHCAESRGIRMGEVIDHAEASSSILQAVREAEDILNMEIGEVELALTGGHIESSNHRGTVQIPDESQEITDEDMEEAVDNARSCVRLGDDRMVLHVIRQQFYLDGKPGVFDPVGQLATRLEADVHCVSGISTRFHNTINCLHSRDDVNLGIKNGVFSGLASALAVLGPEEKQLGAIVLDIGAGTTEYVVYANQMIRQTGVLAVGGDHLVNDIQLGLKLSSRRKAELLIREHGTVWADDSICGKKVTLKTGDLIADREKSFLMEDVYAIMNSRMDEILRIIHERIRAQDIHHDLINGTVYLTGGCSRLAGIKELASSVFELPSETGIPRGFDGQVEHLLEPEMATVVGLVKYGHKKGSDRPPASNGLLGFIKKTLGIEG